MAARDGDVVVRLPVHTLDGIVLLTNAALSTPLMGFCSERGVQISFFSDHGEFYGRVQGPVAGNVLLRREQYRAADDPVRSTLASYAFIAAKVANSRTVLLRAIREKSDLRTTLGPACDLLGRSLDSLHARQSTGALTVDSARGTEGDCARSTSACSTN